LHCIEQFKGAGGDNDLVDGFIVAKYIKENHPETWTILTNNYLSFSDCGYDEVADTKFYKIKSWPVLKYV
jgi:gamma-butyrobetaine dioxygenase